MFLLALGISGASPGLTRGSVESRPDRLSPNTSRSSNDAVVRPPEVALASPSEVYLSRDDIFAARDQPKRLPGGQPNSTRYAFLVNWDPSSAGSMRGHLEAIDILVPEWLHLGYGGEIVQDDPDAAESIVQYLRGAKTPPLIMPLINNYADGSWQGDRVTAILEDPGARENLIAQLHAYVQSRSFHGVTIDFQEIQPDLMESFESFTAELATRMHASGLRMNVVIPLEGSQWRSGILARNADAIIVAAYDYHGAGSSPGAIAPQNWVTHGLQARIEEAGPGKIVLGVANYGYDWRDGEELAETHTFADVMLRARQAGATIVTDPVTLNPTFEYFDIDNEHREVWYLDAVTAFNQIAAADLNELGGVALWRLGAEDPAIWTIFADMANADPSLLEVIDQGGSIDYQGEGEILKITELGRAGKRTLDYDRLTGLIVNQSVSEFPVSHEIARWGGNAGRKLVLTFDDGPDPDFTPRILDILKQYKVPAVFFVLGAQTNRYPDIVRRIVMEGHEIGNHTYTHPNLDRITDMQMTMEINATQRVIESTTGRATLLFRPPYAEDIEPATVDKLRTVLAASDAGYFTVSTRIDGKDWWLARPQAIVERVVEGSHQGDGNIILLHDAGGNRNATVEALPTIIATLQAENFEFMSLASLVGRTRDELMPPVDASINPFLAGDAIGYAVVRSLESGVYFAFMMAIVLTLIRTGFIVLLAVRRRKPRSVAPAGLRVAAIVPAFNEEKVICQTIRSLLLSNWQDLTILVVDDGSKDRTFDIVQESFADEPRVQIVRKENGGKSEALNLGISMLDHDIFVGMDADTIFLPDTIPNLVSHFSDLSVGAVAGNAKVGNRINLMTRWQALEYIVAQNLDRRAFERLNCISVVPGAVGAWRRKLVQDLGGFHSDTLAEDADMTIRVIRAGYVVVYDERAIALTEAPAEVGSFVKQRFRWTYGMMQTALKHLDALTRTRPNSIGLVALPNILIFQLLLPCIAPIADFFFVLALAGIGFNAYVYPDLPVSEDLMHILVLYGVFFALDFAVAVIAFLTERDEQPWLLVLLIPQRFFHRQLLYFVVLKSIVVAVRGRAVGWFKLTRMATVQSPQLAISGQASREL